MVSMKLQEWVGIPPTPEAVEPDLTLGVYTVFLLFQSIAEFSILSLCKLEITLHRKYK